jgi:hypothetical protein
MDGIGIEGVFFIWLGFLWPIFAAIGLYLFRAAKIKRKGYYWFGSIFISYLATYLFGFAFTFLPSGLHSSELLLNILLIAVMLSTFAVPILVSFYISNKCS